MYHVYTLRKYPYIPKKMGENVEVVRDKNNKDHKGCK